MHELGIVFHIIDSVEGIGRENALTSVSKVTLDLGEVSGVIDTYLLDCWRWAADKSELLKGAELDIERIPALTLCTACDTQYPTVENGKTCPNCGSTETYLVQGNEIEIRDVTAV